MKELISVDYEILNFILEKGEASREEIFNKFPDEKYATEYRISLLEKQEYNKYAGKVENSSHILESCEESGEDMFGLPKYKNLGRYYLTELGKKTVHDNKIVDREKKMRD